MEGIRIKRGGAYAFDEEAYGRFFRLAIINGISELSTPDVFLERSSLTGLHFVRIQVVGL